MTKSRIDLKVHCGYTIEEKTDVMNIISAYRLLNTKSQRRYTSAVNKGEFAELTRYILKCPYCGKETPAYHSYIHETREVRKRLQGSDLSVWANFQLTLFDDYNNKLYIKSPKLNTDNFTCKKCGHTSKKSNTVIDISVISDDSSVYINRKLESLVEFFEIDWLSEFTLTDSLSISESIEFNFELGQVFLKLTDEKGKILKKENITKDCEIGKSSLLAKLLSQNKIVKRNIKRMFNLHWNVEIPFSTEEISFIDLINLTRFQNYPRSFYDSIPYKNKQIELIKALIILQIV